MKKGFILVASLFLIAFVAVFLGASIMRADMQFRKIDMQASMLNAFCAAETGVERSIAELRMNGQWRAGFTNENFRPAGSYTVTITDGGTLLGNIHIPTVLISSVGTDAVNPNIKRRIIARVTVENPARYFTSTIRKLTLGDGLDITGSILGRDVVFEPGSKGINVAGNVEYIRSITGQNAQGVNINDNDSATSPDYYQRAPIAFIGVDLERFRQLARQAGRYEEGDLTISGNIDKAALRDPDKEAFNGLVFAEGDIHIWGEIQTPVNIISGGNIYINDNLTCASYSDANGVKRQYQIGLSAHNDVIIPETAPANIKIEAFVIADGGVFEAKRTPAGRARLAFNGAIAIRGKEDPQTGEDLRTGVNLNEYAVRNCVYNTELRDNPQIPFMGYVVNMVIWQEAKP
ncbi:MAG: hypothetical protein PHO42_02685 [Candidatus Omnitrophica bacterium]|nr:hypothetical protein [Candidatus Omnitrophota bacterium]